LTAIENDEGVMTGINNLPFHVSQRPLLLILIGNILTPSQRFIVAIKMWAATCLGKPDWIYSHQEINILFKFPSQNKIIYNAALVS
jgi:hypothetical protein